MEFNQLIKKLQENYAAMPDKVFVVNYNRQTIFEEYLAGFPAESRQEFNCNCCKSFIRQMGGVVSVVDGEVKTLWGGIHPRLDAYIKGLPIRDVFFTKEQLVGTPKNVSSKLITWHHFNLTPKATQRATGTSAEASMGEARSSHDVMRRGFEELTSDAFETVLDLMRANALYRGVEFQEAVQAFYDKKKIYDAASEAKRDALSWEIAVTANASLARMRNTAIGTLLTALSAGAQLETAVNAYERIVAPVNYRRTVAIASPAMIQKAKDELEAAGLLDSLSRRHASIEEIPIEYSLYTATRDTMRDVFAEMKEAAPVNPAKIVGEPTSVSDFIVNALQGAVKVEALIERRHAGNFVSLLNGDVGLFKWPNGFSWAYSGGVADSIAQRVKAAGGKVDGELRASLQWINGDDLDIHLHEPQGGRHIYYGNKKSSWSGAELDVDMMSGGTPDKPSVENIIYDHGTVRHGSYKVVVNQYARKATKDQGFTLEIEYRGEIFSFDGKVNSEGMEVKFKISEKGIEFTSTPQETRSSAVSQVEKWGVKTNCWTPVQKILLSPNHWEESAGNKHFIVLPEGCKSTEEPLPFFNEQLSDSLRDHSKTMEMLSTRVKVAKANGTEASGLGFSETIRNNILMRVSKGKAVRIFNVQF